MKFKFLLCFAVAFLVSCGGGDNSDINVTATNEILVGNWEETFDDVTPDAPIAGGINEGYAFHENGTYEYYDWSKLEDTGTYKIADNYIVFTSATYGFTNSSRFEISDNLLITYFDDGSGGSDRFVRINKD